MNILFFTSNKSYAELLSKELSGLIPNLSLIYKDYVNTGELDSVREIDYLFVDIHFGPNSHGKNGEGLSFISEMREQKVMNPIMIFTWFDPVYLRIAGFDFCPYIISQFSNSSAIVQFPASLESIYNYVNDNLLSPMNEAEWQQAQLMQLNLKITHKLSHILNEQNVNISLQAVSDLITDNSKNRQVQMKLENIRTDLEAGNKREASIKIESVLLNGF